MTSRWPAAPIAVALILSAPVEAADRAPPESTAADPSAAVAAAADGDERAIDLRTALRLADRTFDVEQATEREREARANARAADGGLAPSLGLAAGESRWSGYAQSAFGDIRDATFDTYTAAGTVRLAWNVGDAVYRDLAARRRAEAAAASTDAARQRAVLAVVAGYLDLVEADAAVRIEERLVHDASTAAAVAATRADQGAGSRLDQQRAVAQAAAAEQRLIAERGERRRRAAVLAGLLRLDPSIPLVPADRDPVPARLVDSRRTIADWLAIAQRRRPEAASLALATAAARDDATATRWSAWAPEVSVAASEGYLGDTLDSAEDQRHHAWSVGLGWTLSGASFGRIDAADARAAQARLAAARFEQDTAAAVVAAFADMRASEDQIEPSRREAEAAEAAYELSRSRFSGGILSETDLLLAEQAVDQARLRRLAVVVRATVGQARLLAESGEISGQRIVSGWAGAPGGR